MFEPLPESDEHHDYYTIATLIDITATKGTYKYPPGMENARAFTNIIRNQRRNLNSFMQCIALRAQPIYTTEPVLYQTRDLAEFNFGTNYEQARIWAFNFGVEHKGIYDLPDAPSGALLNDLHNVPIITELLESVEINPAIIDTYNSATRNTVILK